MPDLPADQSPLQDWTPERIRETLLADHGVNWAPPPVEATWKEDQVDSADGWSAWDPETKSLRALSPDELFDLTEAVRNTTPMETEGFVETYPPDLQGDFLAGLPRETPSTTQFNMVEGAMKEHRVPAETRALARWENRMSHGQAMTQSMAHHPAGKITPLRPAIS